MTSSGLPTRSNSGSASGRAIAHSHHHIISSHSQHSSQQHHQLPSSSSASQNYHDNDNDNDSMGSTLLPVPVLPLHDHIPQGPGLAPGGYSLDHTSSSSSSSHLRHHLPPSPEGHTSSSSSSSSMYMNDNSHHHHHQQQHGFGAYAAAAAAMSSYTSLSPPRGGTLNHPHHWDNKDSNDVHPQGQGPGPSMHFQSPVIDRVAQALAARAAKDRDRETTASSSGHDSNQNSSRRASDSGRRSFHEQDDTGLVGSGTGASHRPEVTEEYEGGTAHGASNQAVEHSIQRTESFIKNRLRAAGAGAGAASAHSDSNHGASSSAMTSVPPPVVSTGMEMSHPRGGGGPRVTGRSQPKSSNSSPT